MNFKVGEQKRSSGHRDWIVEINKVTPGNEGNISFKTIQYPFSDTDKPSNTLTKWAFNSQFRNVNAKDVSVMGQPSPYRTIASRQAELQAALDAAPEVDMVELQKQMALDSIMDEDSGF